MRKFFFVLFCFHSIIAKADNLIQGEFIVSPGTTHTYTLNHPDWNSTYENHANVTWTVTYGTVVSETKTSVTIQWDEVPQWLNQEATIEFYEDLGGMSSNAIVELRNFIEGVLATCNGVLGSPSAYINFGAGQNPGPPITNGSITYTYRPYCSIISDEYSVRNNTIACNGGWRSLTEDHTPNDVNGYMLIIDGDDRRGEIYRTTVTGLTQAFGYEFSAYFVNLGNVYERPRVQFEIYDMSNNLIGNSESFPVNYDANDPWKRLSFMFDLPQGTTSIQIVLVNKNNDKLGNDFVVDDIAFAPCFPPIIASYSNTIVVDKAYACNSGTVQLYSRWPTTVVPFSNPGFQWQRSIDDGATWQNITNATSMNFITSETQTKIYQYRMYSYDISNPTQFYISNVLRYFVQLMIVESKNYDFYSCNPVARVLNPSYFMLNSDTDANAPQYTYSFNWSPGTLLSNPTISNPTISLPTLVPPPYNSSTAPAPVLYNYVLTVSNNSFAGCTSSSNQVVRNFNPRKVAIPTAFTPNGDGSNDLFRPINIQDYPGSEFWVYNRYGNLVFNSTGPTLLAFSWNGRYQGQPADIGTYTWRVSVGGCPTNIFNGNGTANPFGNVSLIR